MSKQESNFFLVRHGKTDYNVEERVQGRLGSKLTEEGISYSKKVADVIFEDTNKTNDYALYSSPFFRTKQTTEIICKKNDIIPIFDERIAELNRGIIEGKKKSEFSHNEIFHVDAFNNNPWYYKMPEGENYTDLYERCLSFINEFHINNKNTIIVSHGFTIRMLILILTDSDRSKYNEIRAPHNLIRKLSFKHGLFIKKEDLCVD